MFPRFFRQFFISCKPSFIQPLSTPKNTSGSSLSKAPTDTGLESPITPSPNLVKSSMLNSQQWAKLAAPETLSSQLKAWRQLQMFMRPWQERSSKSITMCRKIQPSSTISLKTPGSSNLSLIRLPKISSPERHMINSFRRRNDMTCLHFIDSFLSDLCIQLILGSTTDRSFLGVLLVVLLRLLEELLLPNPEFYFFRLIMLVRCIYCSWLSSSFSISSSLIFFYFRFFIMLKNSTLVFRRA